MAVDGVVHQHAVVGAVEGQGPEGLHGRQRAWGKAQPVAAAAVQGPALGVMPGQRVDGLAAFQHADVLERNFGAGLEVVAKTAFDQGGEFPARVQAPARAGRAQPGQHAVQCALQCGLLLRIGCAQPGAQAHGRKARDPCGMPCWRRVVAQGGIHLGCIVLGIWRGLGIAVRVEGAGLRGRARLPVGQRAHRKAVLQRVHGGQVVLAIDQDAAYHPQPGRGRGNVCAGRIERWRQRPLPAGRRDQEGARSRARQALAQVGEGVGEEVQQAQHVVAARRVGHVDHQRPGAQVQPGVGVERVVVGRDHAAGAGAQQLARMHELVAPAQRCGRGLAGRIAPGRGGRAHAAHLVQRAGVDDGLFGQGAQVHGVSHAATGCRGGTGHWCAPACGWYMRRMR